MNKWEVTEKVIYIVVSPLGFAFNELRKLIDNYRKG
jgi:hypothetical protein